MVLKWIFFCFALGKALTSAFMIDIESKAIEECWLVKIVSKYCHGFRFNRNVSA